MSESIHTALSKVMADVQTVRKSEKNTQQNFNFRGIDAVMNAVGPALRKHGVIVLPHVQRVEYRDVEAGRNKTPMRECHVTITYRFHGPDGSHLDATVSGEALDSGDKATAKAHSVAYRTALLQALTIPTDEPDPDAESHQRAARAEPAEAPFDPPTAEQKDALKALWALLTSDQQSEWQQWIASNVGVESMKDANTRQWQQVIDALDQWFAAQEGAAEVEDRLAGEQVAREQST